MLTFYDLPKPSDAAIQRSQALSAYLLQSINQQGGVISFATFMESALYHPNFGYYCADTFDLGSRGDFTTAPLISPLFAHCFARQCEQLFALLNSSKIIELGAGTGHFAKDLLLELEKRGVLPEHYYIYEKSSHLRKKQQAFLKAALPEHFSRITWLDALPTGFVGLILANEVLDALPVNCFCIAGNEIKERCVGLQQDKFVWQMREPITTGLLEKTELFHQQYHLYDGYQSEINTCLPDFIANIAESLTKGIILLADYGYGQREYYHPERKNGSLTCFYKHHRHDNPFIYPGLQDITAHVDFTAVIEAAVANQCTLKGYTSQAAFLLSCGLMEMAEETKALSQVEEFNYKQAIKRLTFPTEMGERIKVMALGKHVDETATLLGFQLQDRRRDL